MSFPNHTEQQLRGAIRARYGSILKMARTLGTSDQTVKNVLKGKSQDPRIIRAIEFALRDKPAGGAKA